MANPGVITYHWLCVRTHILNFKEKVCFSNSVRGQVMSAKFLKYGVFLEAVSSKWKNRVYFKNPDNILVP